MQLKITNLTKICKEIIKKDSQIEDIILFGSYMKGKIKPNDIDLLIIFKNKINKEIEKIIKNKLDLNLDINSITINQLQDDNFIAKEGLYLEGLSLKESTPLAKKLGFSSYALLKYDLSNIKGSNRIRFYYALNGRNNQQGFLKEISANKFSEEIIFCQYNQVEKLKDFFKSWNIEYQLIPTLIPQRLNNVLSKHEK
jgi:predicted nucleotidyltransferase